MNSARPPNTRVCPVCLGLPGVLPVANEEALRLTALTGLLLNCTLPPVAKFDRKNYFYPDMPKNYQITQYDMPSTVNGFVDFEFDGGLARVRHHPRPSWRRMSAKVFISTATAAWISTAPACPCWKSSPSRKSPAPQMAYEYLNALVEILRYGGVSDCDMEKGEVRCDVNVSVRPAWREGVGQKNRNQKHEQLQRRAPRAGV